VRIWKKWLRRRVGSAICRGHAFEPCSPDTRCLLRRSSTNTLLRERSLRVKNRMREIRSSGSLRGGAGNIPAYSAQCGRNRSLRARGIVELIIPAIGVGLQDADEGLKMLHGVLMLSIARRNRAPPAVRDRQRAGRLRISVIVSGDFTRW
jgi:hypothetical protein